VQLVSKPLIEDALNILSCIENLLPLQQEVEEAGRIEAQKRLNLNHV